MSSSKTDVGSSLLQGYMFKGLEGVTLVHMLFFLSLLFLKSKAFALGKGKSEATPIPRLTGKRQLKCIGEAEH